MFPLLLSFDQKVNYFRKWRPVILSTLIVAIPFIIWDEIFTQYGIWGFNEDFLLGVYLGSLPLEEVLFFIVVPFACLFIYQCVKSYFDAKKLRKLNVVFYLGLLAFALVLGVLGSHGWYTRIAVGLGLILIIVMFIKRENFPYFPLAFLFALLPFILINGVLTGSLIDAPIVWYNESEFSGVRLLTIPTEDIIYAWDLLVLNVLVFNLVDKK